MSDQTVVNVLAFVVQAYFSAMSTDLASRFPANSTVHSLIAGGVANVTFMMREHL